MIYRAVVEGLKGESIHLFFFAQNEEDAAVRLENLIRLLATDNTLDAYDVQSEIDLRQSATEPYAFVDAYLVESGLLHGRPIYVSNPIVFLTGQFKTRVQMALRLAGG